MAKFFYIPFASHGDVTAVPDTAQDNGSVSYYAGYGSDYQLPLAGGGAALPIDRGQYNQILNDITGAIANIQGQGIFSWVGPVADPPLSGANFPYPINALVYYSDGNIYQSLIPNNQDIPGATLNWVNLSTNTGSPIGTVIDYAGLSVPTNCLNCDGTAYSRTTYANLFTAITNTQNGNTYTSTTVDNLTSTTLLKPGFFVSGSGVQAGTTIASITNSTSLVLSLATTSTVTGTPLVFAPWGIGDGSTTFNVPNLQRMTTIGSGGSVPSGAVVGNVVGNHGGVEAYALAANDLPVHTHSLTEFTGQANAASSAPGSTDVGTAQGTRDTLGNTTTNTPISLMQPSTVMFKAIKFQ